MPESLEQFHTRTGCTCGEAYGRRDPATPRCNYCVFGSVPASQRSKEVDRWARERAKGCIKQARYRLGNGWDVVGPQVREAFVHSEIVALINAQGVQYPNTLDKLQAVIACVHQLLEAR